MEDKESLLVQGSVAGISAIATAYVLSKSYQIFNFYPPEIVYWFFIGLGSYLGVEALEYFQGQRHLTLV